MSAEDEPIFLKFEEAVDPPPVLKQRTKYQPLYEKILALPVCENGAEEGWCRILFPNRRRLALAKSAITRMRFTQLRPQGSDLSWITMPAGGESAWLYLQRRPYEQPQGE